MGELSHYYYEALERAKEHHATSKTYSGKFLRPHAPAIRELIEAHQVASILDYGCGKGEQYRWVSHGGADQSIPAGETLESFWGVQVVKHDPAWPPYAAEPVGQFDMVLVTHVLGSIPLVDLPEIVTRLHAMTRKVLYVAEKLGPVHKEVFTDYGAHPMGWTRDQWAAALRRPSGCTVILSTREVTDQGVITQRSAL